MYKFFLRRKIKKALTGSNRARAYCNLKDIKEILILFDVCDYDDAFGFVHRMRNHGKKVKAIAYKDEKDIKTYPKITQIVTSKDLKNWKGILPDSVNAFLEKEKFDLVVDFNFKENLLLQYILTLVDAPFKVGFYKNDLQLHDMVILSPPESDESPDIEKLSKQLIYYLTTILSSESDHK
jgi:hypothetical protein